jgi:hypothetical protein
LIACKKEHISVEELLFSFIVEVLAFSFPLLGIQKKLVSELRESLLISETSFEVILWLWRRKFISGCHWPVLVFLDPIEKISEFLSL